MAHEFLTSAGLGFARFCLYFVRAKMFIEEKIDLVLIYVMSDVKYHRYSDTHIMINTIMII